MGSASFRRYSDMDSRQKRDRKVTVTVLAIIACFFLTHTPSTIPFIVELSSSMLTKEQSVAISRWMPHLQPAIHAWLLTGKVANFVLFCMSSVYFRRRLNIIIRTRSTRELCNNCVMDRLQCHCDSQQKKYSGVSSGLSMRGQPMKMSTLKYRDAVARQSSCTTHVE
uniref:G_PROTEIN_RECEP_F1_2 domain-containing protein n=1 Tax=Heterorhabditis bacteriophora TaxID=37862 RepID=A0A1I7WN12_HETBA